MKIRQLELMFVLSIICATIAFFEVLTGLSSKKKKALFLLELNSAVLLLSVRGGYIVDGDLSVYGFWMTRIYNFLIFTCTLAVMLFYRFYLSQIFAETENLNPKLKRFRLIDIILIVGEALVILTLFNKFYYYIDEFNVYRRGKGIVLGFSIPLVVLIILVSLTIQYYKYLPKRMRLLLLLFTLNPFFSAIYQLLFMGYETINLSIAGMSILLFIFDLLDMRAIEKRNVTLQKEISQRNEHIIKIQDNMIMSMAMMVESRDNSTGGHIMRTREVVKILLDEMSKDKSEDAVKVTEEFCHNLIKAAPMHDLGKISVDDAILKKPGIFTDAEFEAMKTHAPEGARIMRKILRETDELPFCQLVENVAHYHHERWDGSGYPDGLKGEEIPLEARIMAIADVYDALVSRRVYKEPMSFEQADFIMMSSFGNHFDIHLQKYYVAARPRLEDYYRNLKTSEESLL